MPDQPLTIIVTGSDALGATAAGQLAEPLRSALADGRRASLAVSGGSTPWPMFEHLATLDLDWERVDVYQVDERVAPRGDERRNLTHLERALLSAVSLVAHPMPVDDRDGDRLNDDALEDAAADYAGRLPERFDVVHLGLGDDGHTASLVPDDPVLEVTDRPVAVTDVYQGTRRMTVTYPVLARARRLLWLIEGESKRAAYQRLLHGDPSIPAGRVARDHAVVVTDLTG